MSGKNDDIQVDQGQLSSLFGAPRPLQGCQSRVGFYLGTLDVDGTPNTRESAEYWESREEAEGAWKARKWQQRLWP